MEKTNYISIPLLRDAMYEHTRSYDGFGTDYSVTTLIRPPREVQLTRRFKKELDAKPLTHDIIEKNLASFKGTAIHAWFEKMLWRHMSKNPQKGYLLERRLFDKILGRRISGKFDTFLNGALYDLKTTSVWKKIFGDYTDYAAQLNIYDYMLHDHGLTVNMLQLLMWFMDWERWKIYETNYPKTEIELVLIEDKWQRSVQKDFLYNKVELHKSQEDVPNDQLIACTEDEMWIKPEKWAVYKVKDPEILPQKASRVLDKKDEAEAWAAMHKDGLKEGELYHIIHRPGQRLRCEEYCRAAPYCNIFQDYVKNVLKKGGEDG